MSFGVVRIVLGLLLLSAAVLKGHQLATEPVAGTGLLDSRWFLICVVEFELFFGLWLLSSLLPRLIWVAGLGCFSLFACLVLREVICSRVGSNCLIAIQHTMEDGTRELLT